MSSSNVVIDVKNLCKNFAGNPAVVDLSLQVRSGEIFGFLGPNGSGKTTTIRMLCGLLTPNGGFGNCLGYDILTESKSIRKHVGYIPQFFSLYSKLTVYENILFTAEIYGVTERKKKAEQIMEQLGLSSKKNQLSGLLSGGWKQRLALAAALIHQPFLLLLDEPTASVDTESRRSFWEIMHDLSAKGMTILLSSHNMDEVERCHRIAYICEGQLYFQGKIKEIIKDVSLTTWKVCGKNLILLAKQLEVTPGIDQVITFYDALHVSGKDSAVLSDAINPYLKNPHFFWEIVESSLDDVFVWLTRHQKSKI